MLWCNRPLLLINDAVITCLFTIIIGHVASKGLSVRTVIDSIINFYLFFYLQLIFFLFFIFSKAFIKKKTVLSSNHFNKREMVTYHFANPIYDQLGLLELIWSYFKADVSHKKIMYLRLHQINANILLLVERHRTKGHAWCDRSPENNEACHTWWRY